MELVEPCGAAWGICRLVIDLLRRLWALDTSMTGFSLFWSDVNEIHKRIKTSDINMRLCLIHHLLIILGGTLMFGRTTA